VLKRLRAHPRLLAAGIVTALALLWVRSSHRMDLLVVPIPDDHMIVAASAYGGMTLGFGGDASEDIGGAGFHSIDPNDGGDDASGADQHDAIGAAAAAAGAAGDDDENQRLWLSPGLLQWQLFSGDNELDVEAYFAGFSLFAGREPAVNGSVSIPYWFFIAIVPLYAVWRRWKRWRAARMRERHLCAACGYDLQGNTSGVCPECGRAVPAPASPGAQPDFERPVAPV
jgi:hypothetical protein